MQANITGVVKSWIKANENDVFSSIASVKELIQDRISEASSKDPPATTMIELFLTKSNYPTDEFPPEDPDSLLSFLCLDENSIYRKFATIYFLIDEFNIVQGRSIEDLYDFANLILISEEQVQFVLGCINLDSSISTSNLFTQLTFPGLPKCFEFPILESLIARNMLNDAFAFYICKKPLSTEIEHDKIIINCFSSNNRHYEALEYIRTITDDEKKKELLKILVLISITSAKVEKIANLAFTKEEEEFVLTLDFPTEKSFKQFCLTRRRFDKLPVEGKFFECSF